MTNQLLKKKLLLFMAKIMSYIQNNAFSIEFSTGIKLFNYEALYSHSLVSMSDENNL